MKLIVRSLSLFISSAFRVGRRNMSASNSTMRSASRDMKPAEMLMPSRPALADRRPPTASTASAKAAASRLPAPFSSSAANVLARPFLPGSSETAPPRSTACNPISGTSCFSLSSSTVPLSSSTRSYAGSLTPSATATAGAKLLTTNSSAQVSAEKRLVIVILRRGNKRRAKDANRHIAGAKYFRSDVLHLLGRDGLYVVR